MNTQPINGLNKAQYEVLNMLSCVTEDNDIKELKRIIVHFLNNRLQSELDRMWETGALSEKKFAEWESEHMRTPYK